MTHFSRAKRPLQATVLTAIMIILPAGLIAHSPTQPVSDSPAASTPVQRNAVFVEMFGNTLNLFGVNYERTLRDRIHLRVGASRLTYVDEITYEETGEDVSIKLHTVPVSVSYSFFRGIRKLELGVGATLFSFDFWGGPYDVGYNDIELGNRYLGVALTSTIGYRLSLENYLFRIGLHPFYMLTMHNEISGFFEELEDRGVLDFRDIIDPRGFRIIPGISFGRRF
jgi:hypothetical protein